MLDDEIVLKNCYYWAGRLSCKTVECNELVSIGYLVGKRLKDPRLLKDWIRFSMMKYIVNTSKHTNACIDVADMDVIDTKSKKPIDIFNNDELYSHVNDAGLSNREMSIIRMVFFEGCSQVEIASVLNIKQQTISCYLKRAIMKIRKIYNINKEKE